MHKNIRMRFLTCEPPIPSITSNSSTYVCEGDRFFADPNKWMTDSEGFDINDWSYVVMYDKLSSVSKVFFPVEDFLTDKRLKEARY